MLSFALYVARSMLGGESGKGDYACIQYSTPFLLLEQLHSQNQVMRREILQLSCKAQKKEKDT